MFGRGIRLFRLFGFEVKVDLSWLVLAFLITWSLARGLFPNYYKNFAPSTYWIMGAAGAVGLFVSIVFHELWHSLVARRFGLPMKGITLFIFGGVSEMTDEPANAKVEFFMAVAGPLSSVVLGGILLGVTALARGTFSLPTRAVLAYLGVLNLILAGFNLIPAFPLDGGRVLRSVLWGAKGNLRWATRVASRVGSIFGFLLIAVGVFEFFVGNFVGGIWMFLIGLFLRNAAQASYQQVVVRRALEGEHVRRFMVPDPVTVSPDATVDDLVENYIYKHHFKMYPVEDHGELVGCVNVNQVKEIPRGERERHAVREIARACSPDNTIGPDDDAMNALARMSRTNSTRLMVTDHGRLLGMITLKDLMSFLSLKIDLES